MDEAKRRVLTIDINAQMSILEDIDQKLKIRANSVEPDDEIRLESIAYQIHNLYGASEELLQIIAKYFENNISDGIASEGSLRTIFAGKGQPQGIAPT